MHVYVAHSKSLEKAQFFFLVYSGSECHTDEDQVRQQLYLGFFLSNVVCLQSWSKLTSWELLEDAF
jgi:hypothetical protein